MSNIETASSISLKGEVVCYLFKPGDKYPTIIECGEPIFEKNNTIDTNPKIRCRDTLVGTSSTVNYMGANGYFTACTSGASQDAKDGIVLYDGGTMIGFTTVTTLHPTDPSGNYYKRWRGTYTALQTYAFTHVKLGLYWVGGGTATFNYQWAHVYNTVTVSVGNMYIIDWKISIS